MLTIGLQPKSEKPATDSDMMVVCFANTFTKNFPKTIIAGTVLFTALCILGIYMVQTNQELKQTLPSESKIALDFEYFQDNYAGFRPLEIAVMGVNAIKSSSFWYLYA